MFCMSRLVIFFPKNGSQLLDGHFDWLLKYGSYNVLDGQTDGLIAQAQA